MTDANPRLSRQQALRLVEGAYLAAATQLQKNQGQGKGQPEQRPTDR